MAEKIEAYRSDDGNLHRTREEAEGHDLKSALEHSIHHLFGDHQHNLEETKDIFTGYPVGLPGRDKMEDLLSCLGAWRSWRARNQDVVVW